MKLELSPRVSVGYSSELVAGTLLERRDRFLASVQLESGAVVRAHCINPGRMEAFVVKGARVWLSPAPESTAAQRKCKYSWEAIEHPGIDGRLAIMSTNTVRPNELARALLESRQMPGLSTFESLAAEQTVTVGGHSMRVDFELRAPGGARHFVEVKNCHLVYADGWGYFPDSVSERAARHVDCLAALCAQGHEASVLLFVQRADVVRAQTSRRGRRRLCVFCLWRDRGLGSARRRWRRGRRPK